VIFNIPITNITSTQLKEVSPIIKRQNTSNIIQRKGSNARHKIPHGRLTRLKVLFKV